MASMKYLTDHLRAYDLVEWFFLDAQVDFYHLSKVATRADPGSRWREHPRRGSRLPDGGPCLHGGRERHQTRLTVVQRGNPFRGNSLGTV